MYKRMLEIMMGLAIVFGVIGGGFYTLQLGENVIAKAGVAGVFFGVLCAAALLAFGIVLVLGEGDSDENN